MPVAAGSIFLFYVLYRMFDSILYYILAERTINNSKIIQISSQLCFNCLIVINYLSNQRSRQRNLSGGRRKKINMLAITFEKCLAIREQNYSFKLLYLVSFCFLVHPNMTMIKRWYRVSMYSINCSLWKDFILEILKVLVIYIWPTT